MTNAPADHGPKCIAVIAQKGGQGKSAVALNLTHELAERGHDTVLFDLDPNGHISSDLGYRTWTEDTGRHAGAYLTDRPPELTVDDISITTDYEWDLIPRLPNYRAWNRYLWENADPSKTCLDPLYTALRNHYDYVVIDTGPSKNNMTDATLHSVNHAMIPVRVGDAREVLKNTVQDLVYIFPDGADSPVPRVKVLAIFPTFIQHRIDHNTRDRYLIEELCQDDSTRNAVPNFAFIPDHLFDAIDAGDVDVLPTPGLRKASPIDDDIPLRETAPDHDQLECFEELARIAERGGVDRSRHPAVTTDNQSDTDDDTEDPSQNTLQETATNQPDRTEP